MNKNIRLDCFATICEQQWLYRIGEEGILYSQAQNRFVGLDAAGVLAYQAFDAGASLRDLLASSDLSNAVSTTAEALGTIFALSKGQFPEMQQTQDDVERRSWPVLAALQKADLEVHGIPIRVEYPDEAFNSLCKDCLLSCPSSSRSARFHFCLRRTGKSWKLLANNEEIFISICDEQIGLGMLHAVRSLLYDEAEYDIAFHAAMIASSQHGILLCAQRESGKSTLAAHLVAQGFAFVTDEPALLKLDTASISRVEMPINLKDGIWDILADEWPQLANAPIHVRSDGHRIKLLHLMRHHIASTPQRLTIIVFPQYSPTRQARIETLSPVRTLNLLNEGGMFLSKRVNKNSFELFLKLICSATAFAISYSSLEQADQLMQRILSLESRC